MIHNYKHIYTHILNNDNPLMLKQHRSEKPLVRFCTSMSVYPRVYDNDRWLWINTLVKTTGVQSLDPWYGCGKSTLKSGDIFL